MWCLCLSLLPSLFFWMKHSTCPHLDRIFSSPFTQYLEVCSIFPCCMSQVSNPHFPYFESIFCALCTALQTSDTLSSSTHRDFLPSHPILPSSSHTSLKLFVAVCWDQCIDLILSDCLSMLSVYILLLVSFFPTCVLIATQDCSSRSSYEKRFWKHLNLKYFPWKSKHNCMEKYIEKYKQPINNSCI